MWRIYLLTVNLFFASSVWAEIMLEANKKIDVSLLTSEMKQVVTELEGLSEDVLTKPGKTILTIRRLQGEFSDAERTQLESAITTHNSTKREKEKQKQKQDKISAKSKLEVLGFSKDEIKALVGD